MKPTIAYFRVFKCVAHVHVPDQNRSKLDDKSVKCVLLGVSDESKAYRLFDPVSKKIIVSRNVVFEENESWNWGKSKEETSRDVLEWGASEDEGVGEETNEDEEYGAGSNGDLNEAYSSGTSSPFSEPHEENPTNLDEGRVRRAPLWMRDYETGECLSEEEDLNVMMMLTESLKLIRVLLKRLLKARNGEMLWMQRLRRLKGTKLGS